MKLPYISSLKPLADQRSRFLAEQQDCSIPRLIIRAAMIFRDPGLDTETISVPQ